MKETNATARSYVRRQITNSTAHRNGMLDRLTRIAATVFEVPYAAISLTDCERQWLTATVGLTIDSVRREGAPCQQVILQRQAMVLPDLFVDPDYQASELARAGIRFYAGVPLITPEQVGIGALCVLDERPRAATTQQMAILEDLGAVAMAQLDQELNLGRIDPTSGFPNRAQFIDDLAELATSCPGMPLIASLVDIAPPDQVSTIMRVLGPSYLDQMVADLGRLIRRSIEEERIVYHVAATQFALLAPMGMSLEDYVALSRKRLGGAADSLQRRFGGAVAVGLAPFILGKDDARDVLRMANSAVQDARLHREPLRRYSEHTDEAHRRRFDLVQSFEHALSTPGELYLLFQPRIDLKSGRCRGAEALLRWTHPQLGPVSPAEIVPLIEPTPMIQGLTQWVIAEALDQVTAWRGTRPDFIVSVNVSVNNLRDERFPDQLLDELARRGLPASAIELEVTESTFIRNDDTIGRGFGRLTEAGVSIAIDDFGTGYSSLAYLQRLPAKTVKLDRSFMLDLEKEPRKAALVGTTTMLCQELGYRVVAEGLETAESVAAMVAIGCDEGQGYFFGHPMKAADFDSWHAARLQAVSEGTQSL